MSLTTSNTNPNRRVSNRKNKGQNPGLDDYISLSSIPIPSLSPLHHDSATDLDSQRLQSASPPPSPESDSEPYQLSQPIPSDRSHTKPTLLSCPFKDEGCNATFPGQAEKHTALLRHLREYHPSKRAMPKEFLSSYPAARKWLPCPKCHHMQRLKMCIL